MSLKIKLAANDIIASQSSDLLPNISLDLTIGYTYRYKQGVRIKINFLISQLNHMLWVLKRTVSMSTQNICMFKEVEKK